MHPSMTFFFFPLSPLVFFLFPIFSLLAAASVEPGLALSRRISALQLICSCIRCFGSTVGGVVVVGVGMALL